MVDGLAGWIGRQVDYPIRHLNMIRQGWKRKDRIKSVKITSRQTDRRTDGHTDRQICRQLIPSSTVQTSTQPSHNSHTEEILSLVDFLSHVCIFSAFSLHFLRIFSASFSAFSLHFLCIFACLHCKW